MKLRANVPSPLSPHFLIRPNVLLRSPNCSLACSISLPGKAGKDTAAPQAMNSVSIWSITAWDGRLLDFYHVNCQHHYFSSGRYKRNPLNAVKMSNISRNFGRQLPWCSCSSLGGERNSLVTSRLGSCSSAMPNSPAFFLPFCLLALLSSTNADVGSMIDRAVSSSQDKTQENISRLWTLHESHFWLWRWGRQANTEVICQRRTIEGTLYETDLF